LHGAAPRPARGGGHERHRDRLLHLHDRARDGGEVPRTAALPHDPVRALRHFSISLPDVRGGKGRQSLRASAPRSPHPRERRPLVSGGTRHPHVARAVAMAGAVTSALRVRCPAKINLGLWILGRRPDGYHEIDTILQTVAHEDELLLTPSSSGFSIDVRGLSIPGPGPNIVERAWSLLETEGHLPRGAGIRVRLTKRIPAGGGLGGGSSDAAGFLAGVNRLFRLELSEQTLEGLCSRLGADVTFLLRGGTARATGRGDRVRHLCPISQTWVVLATPPVAISTTWAYEQVRNRL